MFVRIDDFCHRRVGQLTRMRVAVQSRSNAIYGWFDNSTQCEPTHEPPRDAPCLYCGFRIHESDVRTHNLIFHGEYAARSYFYRTHRTCAEKDSGMSMDGFVLDMIARSGD